MKSAPPKPEVVKPLPPRPAKQLSRVIPLTEIRGLGAGSQAKLELVGIKYVAQLARASPRKLAERTGVHLS